MATTQHAHGPNFGRTVPDCPRCQELQAGATPIDRSQPNPDVTRHSCNGGRGPAFGRKDPECPRCQELQAGAPARTFTWTEAAKRRADADRVRAEEIRAHDCQREHDGGVCTAFDW